MKEMIKHNKVQMCSPSAQTPISSANVSKCLPNSLFFRQQSQPNFQEETLNLQAISRQNSICNCGRTNCICDDN